MLNTDNSFNYIEGSDYGPEYYNPNTYEYNKQTNIGETAPPISINIHTEQIQNPSTQKTSSKLFKSISLILALSPALTYIASLATILGFVFAVAGQLIGYIFYLSVILTIIFVFLQLLTPIVYTIYTINNNSLKTSEKVAYCIAIWLISAIACPVYWLIHIRDN